LFVASIPERLRAFYVQGRRRTYAVPTLAAVDHELMQLASRRASHPLERPSLMHDIDLLLLRRVDLMAATSTARTHPDVTLGEPASAAGTA
jgi:hypothetical protein